MTTKAQNNFAIPHVKVPAEHEQLWPYCRDQLSKMPILMERLKAWKSVVEELEEFFQTIQSIELSLSKEHAKLIQRLKTADHYILAGNNEIFSRLEMTVTKCGDEHNIFAKTVTEVCVKQLHELKSTISKRAKAFKHEFENLNNQVTRERMATVQSISFHEKAKARRVQGGGRDKSPVDPWLTERILYKQLRTMVVSENMYQDHVLSLIKDVGDFDAVVVRELKRTFDEFVQNRANQMTTIMGQLDRTTPIIANLDPPALFFAFDKSVNLKSSKSLTTERTLSSFPYTIREIRIVKQGVLCRPGFWNFSAGGATHGVSRLNKPNDDLNSTLKRHKSTGGSASWSWSWKPALFVVTESGYLHCFKELHGVKAGDERRRRQAESRNGTLVPPSPEVLAMEDNDTPAYENLDKPNTYYSVCINKAGRVTVQVVADKPNQHVFALIVQDASKGCQKYEIKANSEEDMIEWVATLRAMIESFVPQAPPTPIFSSTQQIVDRVEETIQKTLLDSAVSWATSSTTLGEETTEQHLKVPESQEPPSIPSPSPIAKASISRKGKSPSNLNVF